MVQKTKSGKKYCSFVHYEDDVVTEEIHDVHKHTLIIEACHVGPKRYSKPKRDILFPFIWIKVLANINESSDFLLVSFESTRELQKNKFFSRRRMKRFSM